MLVFFLYVAAYKQLFVFFSLSVYLRLFAFQMGHYH